MSKPLAIDLFCGLGGWAEGFLAEGYHVVGFDIERHDYGTGSYPADLVLQDVRTLHGSQFKDVTVIVASPPCQKYSYMAMPWSRAKAMTAEIRASQLKWAELNELFVACFRIANEAGVPLIVENVRGAIPWVGPAKWHYGSFYLWGDVPALMPMTFRTAMKNGVTHRSDGSTNWYKLPGNNGPRRWEDREVQRLCNATKNDGGSWFNVAHNTESGLNHNPVHDAVKQGGEWWHDPQSKTRRFSSKSNARKAASAQIAKIPLPLARHIARCFKPE